MVLRFRKIVPHNKISNKTGSTKNQENSAHRFGDNHLTSHLVPEELELLEYALIITFFRENR